MNDAYTAVIFTSRHSGLDPDGYETAAEQMAELAARQSGFRGLESARSSDGVGITVSYWDNDADALAWKRNADHLAIQQTGRDRWYLWYRVRVATVEREYGFDTARILHIALPEDWADARSAGEYRVSTRGLSLDQQDFIHCAFSSQLEGVANRFYADLSELLVLHIDLQRANAELRVEPAADGIDELFPHLYGPLPIDAVVEITSWHRQANTPWRRSD